jgi:hypothetical protein
MFPNDNSYEKIKSLFIPQGNVRKQELFFLLYSMHDLTATK